MNETFRKIINIILLIIVCVIFFFFGKSLGTLMTNLGI